MRILQLVFFMAIVITADAQQIKWDKDGSTYYRVEGGEIIEYSLPGNHRSVLVAKASITPAGADKPLEFEDYSFSPDGSKLLLFTNTEKVWRYNTRGDYWLYDLNAKSLIKQLGKARAAASLMFAKFSPDGTKAAYVSEYNLYVEDLSTGEITALTAGGHRKLINGTFDWAYEEEFFCRDGFRWCPDSRNIAYWQIDAGKVKDHIMINNTDSIYPQVIPVEYPVAGELPSPFKIGVVNISTAKTKWMNIPYNTELGSYVPRMEWADSGEIILQHLNRKQNESRIMLADIASGNARTIYEEKDSAWIDILPVWDFDYWYGGWDWINNGREFIWASEKDGWRHLYRVSKDGKETLITKGNYDVMDISIIDEKNNYIYFFASPENATQKYLYRTKLDGSGTAGRISPSHQIGTHNYNVSPTAAFAYHTFSNYYTPATTEWISFPEHHPLLGQNKVNNAIAKADKHKVNVEFFKIKTTEGVEMDAWMSKPARFDSAKKYPVVFSVYTEPWGQEVKDEYGIANNFLYKGNMSRDGYFYIAIDNRGTPVPKGRDWRKAVYRKIGRVNIKDQAMAAREVLKWNFIDTSRVAVWGWSGGGSATLNLMFQYPEIYKTGISVAAVANQLTYDNIYQERYMGLPQENRQDFIAGSPVTYAKNLRGNLLYIHGTGDDNVHYNNAEMLLNELIKHNRQFQFMPYPNRSHSISEGEGTLQHLSTLYTNFLKQHCPPGGK